MIKYKMIVKRESTNQVVFKLKCGEEFVDDGMFFDMIDAWSIPGYVIKIKSCLCEEKERRENEKNGVH